MSRYSSRRKTVFGFEIEQSFSDDGGGFGMDKRYQLTLPWGELSWSFWRAWWRRPSVWKHMFDWQSWGFSEDSEGMYWQYRLEVLKKPVWYAYKPKEGEVGHGPDGTDFYSFQTYMQQFRTKREAVRFTKDEGNRHAKKAGEWTVGVWDPKKQAEVDA